MKVAVCVKRVPSTATRLRIGAGGRAIDESGVDFVLNPYDEFALEEALRLVEKAGGEVTVVSLGTDAVTKELRNCLATGAQQAIHLKTDAAFGDPLATARVLAETLQPLGCDVILFGRQAVDDDHAQVGLMVATLLDLPAVPDIVKCALEEGAAPAAVLVEREVEGAVEKYRVPLPCVLTAQKGLNEPRLPNMKGIMAAKKKTIETRAATPAAAGLQVESLELPAERKGGRIVGEGAAAVPELLKLLRNEAGVI